MGVMKKHDVTNKKTIQKNNSLLWIQSLPAFQTKPKTCKIDWGHKKTWPDQQKDNDEDKYKDNDKDNDKYI